MFKIKLLLLAVLLNVFAYSQTSQEYRDFILDSEGYSNTVYKCSHGFPTVGIGHRIYTNKTKRYYSDREIDQLFHYDLSRSISYAQNTFEGFDYLPKNVKLVLVSLCFNLGHTGINRFSSFIAHINNRNYISAAQSLNDSRWNSQLPSRSNKYQNILIQEHYRFVVYSSSESLVYFYLSQ